MPPLPDADGPAKIAALSDGFAGRLKVYRVMARHPALLVIEAHPERYAVRANGALLSCDLAAALPMAQRVFWIEV
jgi:hypothetical protein